MPKVYRSSTTKQVTKLVPVLRKKTVLLKEYYYEISLDQAEAFALVQVLHLHGGGAHVRAIHDALSGMLVKGE